MFIPFHDSHRILNSSRRSTDLVPVFNHLNLTNPQGQPPLVSSLAFSLRTRRPQPPRVRMDPVDNLHAPCLLWRRHIYFRLDRGVAHDRDDEQQVTKGREKPGPAQMLTQGRYDFKDRNIENHVITHVFQVPALSQTICHLLGQPVHSPRKACFQL
ncbi:hypothetical protein N656DRAFT_457052 [Canariomyces notabilis]|uniref:Uncharacterized protein n=1 Tax=Canariomyces notabilis TaxID=2074819 RepID=A0AAN6T8P3_9PEZI|nr:hypothetical protein N656DRAFT_457052 [Canariomyces arenarius]